MPAAHLADGIAGTLVAGGVLVTRDEKIRAHAPCAVW